MPTRRPSPKRIGAVAVGILLFGVVIGWFASGWSGDAGETAVDPDDSPPASDPSPTVGLDEPIANPVLATDFPDPDVIASADGYLAFATTSGGRHVQVSHSSDLLNWSEPEEALPDLPPWMPAERPDLWAPDVVADGDRWVMAFSGREAVTRRMCIGLATSAKASGPYQPLADPLVCPTGEGGAIDPAIVIQPDATWLYWKVDGNCCGQPVRIMVQQFDLESLSLVGDAVTLLTPELEWEEGVIEAPDPIVVDGTVHLLYSGGRYAGDSYGVGIARCESITGPCTRPSAYQLFESRAGAIGPGGTSVITTPDARRSPGSSTP
jgi:beta-xylosidase